MKNVENLQLTGLRGFAALIVILDHNRIPFSGGQAAVMLFFALSGYLMGLLYLHQECDFQTATAFCAARAGRIIPAYYFTILIVYFCSSQPLPPMVPALFISGQNVHVLWTVPLEVQFYCLFLTYWYLHRLYPPALCRTINTILLCAYSSACIQLATGSSFLPNFFSAEAFARVYGRIVTFLPYFYGGTILGANHCAIEKARLGPCFTTLALVCFLIPWTWRMQKHLYIAYPELSQTAIANAITDPVLIAFGGLKWWHPWVDPLTVMSAYTLLLSAAQQQKVTQFLGTPFFVYLGRISFGCYLYHPIAAVPVYNMLSHIEFGTSRVWLHNTAGFLFVFALTLGISHLSFYCIELPLAKGVRRIAMAYKAQRATALL